MREPRPDWSPLGVNFKIVDEHPHLFYISSPPPPPGLLDGNCYEMICREISSSEAKESPGRKYKGQGRGFTTRCLHEATRFQQSGFDGGTRE